ncbi:YjjG family noncanonical pyrimidine nucleotidase [Bacillus sp. 1P06AnD]|uniref:YjjG family noncanonical pyrimidine nucleotidase n=1 Tax=Bacillus sp. 1P06AnD TaxID=3132208 RepID=UPI0039A0817E
MKAYQTLLFDVDDTLLDFGAAEQTALRSLFDHQQLLFTSEMESRYKEINQGLWRLFEQGEIGRDEVVHTRHSSLFREFGREVDGVLMEKVYRGFLEQGHQLMNGAMELISELNQQQYDLYIVTNGVSSTQNRRLRDSGLFPLFKDIFVSEATGFQKPMKEYFDYVFARIPDFREEQGLIIGDSLSADIKGGQAAGLDTCWFNPKMKANDTEIVPTYEIHSLEELYAILKTEKNWHAASECS